MRKCMIFFILINITFLVPAKRIKIPCPSYCTCEIYSNLKKATCAHRTIVVADLDLPSQTQILDLSFNRISHLKEYVFLNNKLSHLQLLNMSHNRLADVNIFAFEGLERLKVLDLSFNILQQIFRQWFETLNSLEFLFLKGNHFRDMSSLVKDAFSSEKLKVLDLSECHITYITGEIFNLPNLVHLDLSENQLISLNQEVINPLSNLRLFKIENNFLNCDKDMKKLKNLLNSKNIQYIGDPCKKILKFEKMVFQTTEKIYDENNLWVMDDKQEILDSGPVQQIPCQQIPKVKPIIEISDLPYTLLILTVLVYGILIGLLCGRSTTEKN